MNAIISVALLALAPELPQLVVQAGHRGEAVSLAFSEDGRRLASAAERQDLGEEARVAGEVKLWDLESGKLLRTLPLAGDTVRLAGSVVAVHSGRTLQLFDGKGGHRLELTRGRRACAAFDATPHGLLAIADDDGSVTLEDAASGRLVKRIAPRLDGPPRSLAVSRDGRRVAVATDGNVFIADVGTGATHAVTDGADQVVALAFSRDGALLAGVGWHGDVVVWEAAGGRARVRLELGPMSEERTAIDFHGMPLISGVERTARASVAFSPDGRRLAAANRGNARVWDLGTRRVLASLDAPGGDPDKPCVNAIAWAPDGKLLATAGRGDGTIRLSDARTFEAVTDLGVRALVVNQLATSPVDPLLALASSDGSVKLWDASRGRELRVLDGLGAPAVAVAFGAGGRLVAGASLSRIDVWEVASGEWAATLTWDQGTTHTIEIGPGVTVPKRDARLLTALALSPDGRFAAALRSADLEPADVALFDLSTQRLARTLSMGGKSGQSASSIAFSNDGKLLAVAGSAVSLWRPETGERAARIEIPASSLAFSRDGRRLALGGPGGVTIVDVTTGTPGAAFPIAGVSAVDFGAGDLVAVTSMDGSVVMLDVAKRSVAAHTAGHGASALGVAFFADGRRVASIGDDLEARIWDSESGALLATLAIVGPREFVAAAPDGHYLASPAASAGIAFRLGAHAFPFEQFDLMLNRPDIVLGNLGYARPDLLAAYRAAHQRRAARMGASDDRGEVSLPSVELVKPPPLATRAATVTLRYAAKANGAPLTALDVTVNGVPVFGRRGVALVGSSASGAVEVPLASGPNQIALSARDARGLSSLRRTVRVVREAEAAAEPHLFLVAIGVSRYRDATHDLHFADRDAKDIAAALGGTVGFTVEEPRLLVNEAATREAILASRQYLARSGSDDLVVLSLSGHGFRDAEDRYLFASTDADFKARSGGVRYEEIEDLLDGIAAQRKLVLIDTCQSGESDEPDSTAASAVAVAGGKGVKSLLEAPSLDTARELARDLFADLRVGTGATVIAAAGGQEYALELADLKNGVFTHAVIQGLLGGARRDPRDGRLHVSELRDFTIERVRSLTRGRQVPMSRRENVALDFTLPVAGPK